MTPIQIVLVSAPSGTGKTTLVERLIPALRERGFECATVKHHRGMVAVDQPGKDTWRHRRAGAMATFFVTKDEVAAFMDRPAALDPADLIPLCPQGVRVLLVEGFKGLRGYPRVEIVRQGMERDLPCKDDVLCVATDIVGFQAPCPVLPLDDVGGLADLLVRHLTSNAT